MDDAVGRQDMFHVDAAPVPSDVRELGSWYAWTKVPFQEEVVEDVGSHHGSATEKRRKKNVEKLQHRQWVEFRNVRAGRRRRKKLRDVVNPH